MGGASEITTNISTSDLIAIIGLIINAFGIFVTIGLALWIGKQVQEKQSNKRVLKDHLISEIKEIRVDYKSFLTNLYSNRTNPKTPIPWFKLMNIRVDDVMQLLHERYKIDENLLHPYQYELRKFITENEDFIRDFKDKGIITFSEVSKAGIIKFQQKNVGIFNQLIIKINDAD